MIFVGTIEREETFTVDGYSKAKTINGVLGDFGRYIRDNISYREESLVPANVSDGGYFLEIEEVPCATRYIDNTVEYKEANYYICARFVK